MSIIILVEFQYRTVCDCDVSYKIENALVKHNAKSTVYVFYAVIIQYLLHFQTADLIICTHKLYYMHGWRAVVCRNVVYHRGTESILS